MPESCVHCKTLPFTCRFTIQHCCQFALIATAILVELLYITRGALLVYWYASFSKLRTNTTDPVENEDSQGFENIHRAYFFTVAVLAIGSILRCIEYIPFFIGLWEYLGGKGPLKVHHKLPRKYYFISVALLIPVSMVSIAILAIGIANKPSAMPGVFVAYICINFVTNAWSFSVQLGMVLITLQVKRIWKHIDDTIRTKKPSTATSEEQAAKTRCESYITASDFTDGPLHAKLREKYANAGERVKKRTQIFQKWFLFPWIIYFLLSSLKAKYILLPWSEREEEVELLSLVAFMLYNINQMSFIIISFLCAKKMNHYHHQCVERIQEQQLYPGRGEESLAEQRKILIQVDENYDFVPRVWGLGFKVKMTSFIYTIFLLLGLVFTLFTPLL